MARTLLVLWNSSSFSVSLNSVCLVWSVTPNLLMPCHKLFLNLQWVVPQELKNLDIEVVTITKIYWTFREKVIRVCFFGIQFNRSHPLPVKKTPTKFNIHLHPQSKSFKDLYEVLGYHALDNKDPLLEELLCFMSSIKEISFEKLFD